MRMNPNLVILPTRNRPDAAKRCVDALAKCSVQSDICVAIDNDQADLYPRLPGVIYEINPRLRMNGTLNLVANKYADKYSTVFFLGDDHLVRTPGWDATLAAPIASKGYGLAYGNDLLMGRDLATAVMMSTNIIRALGFMAPPKLIHLCMDDFWMNVGSRLAALFYFDQVIIEHLHPIAGKQRWDAGYIEANSDANNQADRAEISRYLKEEFDADVGKIIAHITK
jgi:hypothetical protein